MAFSKYYVLFITLAIVAILVPSISAVEYVVGDEKGWTINFDYQAWAQGKEFHVGDKLVFKYPEGVHNVFKVDGSGFKQCSTPAGAGALTSGNDVVTLASPGRKWYICGVVQHCQMGNQKLFFTVLEDQVATPSPSWSPSPSPSQNDQPSPSTATTITVTIFGFMSFIITTAVLGLLFA